jgi:hypothetical protein
VLIPVCIASQEDGTLLATVPDIPAVTASDSELGRALTRIHLKLEGFISEQLLAEEKLPEVRTLSAIRAAEPAADCTADYYEIHINLTHLRAVARHQR